MNTNLGKLNFKQIGIAALAAAVIAAYNVVSPALQAATQSGYFFVDWAIVGYSALNTFLATCFAFILTDKNGNPLGIGKK